MTLILLSLHYGSVFFGLIQEPKIKPGRTRVAFRPNHVAAVFTGD